MNPAKPCILTVAALTLAVLFWTSIGPTPALAGPGDAPRLILLVAVDQMGYDYLPRFADAFTGGFRRLTHDGAVFTNAHLDHYPSVTAVGHAAMLTGAPPSISGIVGNDWYDRELKRNVTSVEDRVGLARTVVIVTADHGVARVPEQMTAWKMPGGRLSRAGQEKAATDALEKALGPGAWLEGRAGSALYLNRALMAERGLEPYWMSASAGTTHGTAYSYDTHIPLMVMGPGIRAGRHDRTVLLTDLAPTLATLLGIETPSGSSGETLAEILDSGGPGLPVGRTTVRGKHP